MRRMLIMGLFGLLAWAALSCPAHADGPPIFNITVVSPTVGIYEPFIVTCTVGTAATTPHWPYDPTPPSGLPARTGVSVDAIIRSPAGTVITYPLYLHTPYTYTARTYDHLYPTGDPFWTLRFAPTATGTWTLTLRAEDDSGVTTSAPLAFTAVPTTAYPHGFIRVSPTDPRYFSFSDGIPFLGLGHGGVFSREEPVQDADDLTTMAADGVNLLRVWASGSGGFFSASWPAWVSAIGGNDSYYLPRQSLAIDPTWGESDVSLKLTYPEGIPCFFQGTWSGMGTWPVSVLPNRTYRVRARVLVRNVTGPRVGGQPYGFVVKTGGWLSRACADAGAGTPRTPHVTNTGGAWVVVIGTITAQADQYFLDNLFLALENVVTGEAYVDEVWLEEDLGGGRYGPNLLHQPDFDYHLAPIDDQRAALWDRVLEKAAEASVYLKIVLMEKNDWIYDRITPSGAMATTGSNDNFYAAPDTKARWLARALWRYVTARWGYSTAVHSWELLNEGDPYNGHHYEMAQDFARCMHAADPHMVTTSFWASFPMKEFWANSAYLDLDYADLHAYVSTGWKSYPVIPDGAGSPLSYTDARDYDGSGWSVAVDGASHTYSRNLWSSLDIRGEGEWLLTYRLRLEGWSGSCSHGDPDTLSGPRMTWWKDGEEMNVVPPRPDGRNWGCSTPATPTGWVMYDSAHTAEGVVAPLEARIIITDDVPHDITIGVQNWYGDGGMAYVDAVELIAPDGTVLPINGSFDLSSRSEHDAALQYDPYARLYGGGSPAGAGKPLVRGETGLDMPEVHGEEQADLASDVQGVWLHNLTWGQVGPGGMTDLYYWTANIKTHGLDPIYGTFRRFMDGIPLDNGHYRGAGAIASHPDLRAWGQKDTVDGKAHLWVQNRNHTWRNVVDGVAIPGLSGQITIPGMKPGPYKVEWWDTYTGAIVEAEAVEAGSNGLVLALPAPLTDDVAVKVSWMGPALGASTKTVNRFTAGPEDILTYTVSVVNSGVISVTAAVTDEIPANTSYVAGSADVTPDAGDLDDAAGIRWRGELDSGERVTITFAVQVGPGQDPYVVSNVAVIEAGSERIERRALTIVNALEAFLPVILKDR